MVKRYSWSMEDHGMREQPSQWAGGWVQATDYATLEARCRELEEALGKIIERADQGRHEEDFDGIRIIASDAFAPPPQAETPVMCEHGATNPLRNCSICSGLETPVHPNNGQPLKRLNPDGEENPHAADCQCRACSPKETETERMAAALDIDLPTPKIKGDQS